MKCLIEVKHLYSPFSFSFTEDCESLKECRKKFDDVCNTVGDVNENDGLYMTNTIDGEHKTYRLSHKTLQDCVLTLTVDVKENETND